MHGNATILCGFFCLMFGVITGSGSGCYLDFSGSNDECGNGVQEAGEICDGSDFGDQTCDTAVGVAFGSLSCTPDCQLDVSGCNTCGNGIIELLEACDDGNRDDDDGCSPSCEMEPGWICSGEPTECETLCGDGIIAGPEQCEDGNTTGGDGCGPSCLLEECGNGVLDPGEQCDDGNNHTGDGCGLSCQFEACGNGVLDPGEQCDDGNQDETDACLTSCEQASCGDGYIQSSIEICEPGAVSLTCVGLGFTAGTLACGADCQSYDTSGCYSGEDGDPCTSHVDCQSGQCWSEPAAEFPSGFCTRDCQTTGLCDPGYQCINTVGTNEYCYELCSSSADCRPSYFCRPDPWSGIDFICRPLCTTDVDCPHTGICDPYIGFCGSAPDPTDGDNGAPCADDNDCRGECWLAPSGGYCVSPCDLSAPACPGGSVCSDIYPGSADLGYCLQICTGPTDCTRSGYSCQPNPYAGSGSVCLP